MTDVAVDAPPPGAILTGAWGGEHARLSLTSSGGAIEYDCAHGSLTEPLRIDRAGRFTAAGLHVRGHGGPIRQGEAVDPVPALFHGAVAGDRLTLQVLAGTDTVGSFVLRQGGSTRLWKCL